MPHYSLIKISFLILSTVATTALAGCDDGAPQRTEEPPVASLTRPVTTAEREWIEVKDRIAPERWLASREAGREAAAEGPETRAFRALLAQADDRFTEGPRMIANRAVQVEAMLAERGIRETPRSIITDLVAIAGEEERAGFGETCQHYVNARLQGNTRAAALAQLRRGPFPQGRAGDAAPDAAPDAPP